MLDAREAVTCPAWCAPTHCDGREGHADVRHSSIPEVWRAAADDVQLEVAVLRDDDEAGFIEHGVVLRLQNLADPDTYADVVLAATDIARLERVFAAWRELSSN